MVGINQSSTKLIKLTAIITLLMLTTACSTSRTTQPKSSSETTKTKSPSPILESPTQTTVQFTSEQIRDLKSLGIKIAVPSYVPEGFRVDQVQAVKDQWGSSYIIIYRAPNNSCFAIEAASGGIGDVIPDDPNEPGIPINSSVLGRARLYTKPLVSSWLSEEPGEPPVYGFRGEMVSGDRNCIARNISPPEAVKIIESLQYLDF